MKKGWLRRGNVWSWIVIGADGADGADVVTRGSRIAAAARQFDLQLILVSIATARYGRSINGLLRMTATQEGSQVEGQLV